MTSPPRQPEPVSLRRLFPTASFVGCADIAVHAATDNSTHCTPGCLFVTLPGHHVHGRDFVPEALRGGAASILTDRPLAEFALPQCVFPDIRRGYAELCQALHRHPSRRLGLVGITGTNGKSTTAWLTRSLLRHLGLRTGLLGTIEYDDGQNVAPATLTTPDPATLAEWLSSMVSQQTAYAAIEISSHALDQDRAAGVGLDVAVVTNITRDHFDYHQTLEAYTQAKSRIVSMIKPGGLLLLNADDTGSLSLAATAPEHVQVRTFGIRAAADVQARILRESIHGTRVAVSAGTETAEFETNLIGRHNVENCLAVIASARHFGIPLADAASGLTGPQVVPGRLQRIDAGQPFSVFVDYAHTPDALHHLVQTVRRQTPGRVIVVFGAGGDRDRDKRPLMAEAASAADHCIVTSDNPRNEDPCRIIDDVMAGFLQGASAEAIIDRRSALATAFSLAEQADCVIVAGKGHERVQVVESQRLPFDDVAVCHELLAGYGRQSSTSPRSHQRA